MNAPLADRVALCSWSLRPESPEHLIEQVRACGVQRIQLALDPLRQEPDTWRGVGSKLASAGMSVVSGMIGFIGEDYSTLASIRQTGGVLPDEHWPDNQRNVERAIADTAALQLTVISGHIGFIAGSLDDEAYRKVVDRTRWIADRFAQAGLTLLLETGQETAEHLGNFLDIVERDNVAVNFDPANMILYGKGDPVQSLQALLPRVQQVHIKDAVASRDRDQWGREVPVGEGDVDFPAFLRVLQDAGYEGDLAIEREAGDQRVADMRLARERLSQWLEGR